MPLVKITPQMLKDYSSEYLKCDCSNDDPYKLRQCQFCINFTHILNHISNFREGSLIADNFKTVREEYAIRSATDTLKHRIFFNADLSYDEKTFLDVINGSSAEKLKMAVKVMPNKTLTDMADFIAKKIDFVGCYEAIDDAILYLGSDYLGLGD